MGECRLPPFDFALEAHNIQKANALCLMQVKDEGKVPQTVVDSFVRNTSQIVENSVNLVKSALSQCLDNAGLQMENIPGINEIFNEESIITTPFGEIQNEAAQLTYYKKTFGMVVR